MCWSTGTRTVIRRRRTSVCECSCHAIAAHHRSANLCERRFNVSALSAKYMDCQKRRSKRCLCALLSFIPMSSTSGIRLSLISCRASRVLGSSPASSVRRLQYGLSVDFIRPGQRHRSLGLHPPPSPTRAPSTACSATTRNMSSNSVMWFRKGLRLHDNPALREASSEAQHMYPIFILDPWFLTPERVGAPRVKFLLESLQDLSESLAARGSKLIVLQGKPDEVLKQVLQDWKIDKLCFETDTEPYAKERDAKIGKLAKELGVQIFKPVSHTLYDTEVLLKNNGGSAPLTMQSFEKLVRKIGPPPAPCADPPAKLPGPDKKSSTKASALPGVPSLADLKYPEIPLGQESPFKGGESAALARLADSMSDKSWVCKFEKPKTNPADFMKPATTVLSPYLKFGCLSARTFYSQLMLVYKASNSYSKPPVSLEGQLLWREFFYTIGASSPNFDKMEGNPICRQIPWDRDQELLQTWQEARTGYPWIDAIMTQLKQWGWMHHLARHSVACFLTRGDLWVHWEEGRDVFDRDLIDADWSINNGNWMWLSASAFFSQYFRVYGPVSFGKKYDKNGDFVRHFLPVLKDMPAKYIYEPWTAPMDVQRKAKCIIGKDYPEPIVDHGTIHKENISKMAEAYRMNKDEAASGGSAGTKRKSGAPDGGKKKK